MPPSVSTCRILAQNPLLMAFRIGGNCLPFLSAGAKAFVCDQCGAQFSKEDALETHRQTHTGELSLISTLRVLHGVTVYGDEVS